MLNNTRLKVYIHAYTVRLNRGELLDDIDDSYRKLKRLTDEEISQVHRSLNK